MTGIALGEAIRQFLPILLGFYLLDAVYRVPPCGSLHLLGVGGKPRAVAPGLRVAGLAPWKRVRASWRPGLVLAEEGCYLPIPDRTRSFWSRSAFLFVAWDQVHELELRGSSLIAPCGRRTRAVSSGHASRTRDGLRRIAALDPSDRRREVAEHRSGSLDVAAVAVRLELLEAWSRRLEIPVIAAWVGLVVATLSAGLASPAGVALTRAGLLLAGVGWLSVLGVVRVATSSLAHQGAGRLRGQLGPLALMPGTALRASTSFGETLVAEVDDLAISAAQLSAADLARRLEAELHALAQALGEADKPWRELLEDRRRRRQTLAQSLGWAPDALPARPRTDGTAVSYCPLCDAEFVTGPAECSECELPVRPFSDSGGSPGPGPADGADPGQASSPAPRRAGEPRCPDPGAAVEPTGSR